MRYSTGILTIITLTAAFVLSGCDSSSEEIEEAESSVVEANQEFETAISELEAELQEFRADNQRQIEEYGQTINEIGQKIGNESDSEVKERLETKLDELEETHKELKREMDNYQASGKDDWKVFKDSFSDRMDDLGNSLKNFFST